MVGHFFFMLPKPQQTGNGLLIRHGEGATPSGSTLYLPGKPKGMPPCFLSPICKTHPGQRE